MDKSVLLIDAGYLFAQGGLGVHGIRDRQRLVIDAGRLIGDLRTTVEAHGAMPLLRTYWYDGARNGVMTKQHLDIAELPFVKLRLGRINAKNKQKGVDALIYRDLMTLAAERSVAQAYLLSGDDDLREGVTYAQDRGVRVILLGVADKNGNSAQARELKYEADQVLIIDTGLIAPGIQCLPQEGPVRETQTTELSDVRGAGKKFAVDWCAAATTEAVKNLLARDPEIPRNLDAEILRVCEEILGRSLRSNQTDRRLIREGFWSHVRSVAHEVNE